MTQITFGRKCEYAVFGALAAATAMIAILDFLGINLGSQQAVKIGLGAGAALTLTQGFVLFYRAYHAQPNEKKLQMLLAVLMSVAAIGTIVLMHLHTNFKLVNNKTFAPGFVEGMMGGCVAYGLYRLVAWLAQQGQDPELDYDFCGVSTYPGDIGQSPR